MNYVNYVNHDNVDLQYFYVFYWGILFINIFIVSFIYLKMSKEFSAKYYQDNKGRLQ